MTRRTLRDADYRVPAPNAVLLELQLPDQLQILEALQRRDQRTIGTGHFADAVRAHITPEAGSNLGPSLIRSAIE
jgi:hypothetical protein